MRGVNFLGGNFSDPPGKDENIGFSHRKGARGNFLDPPEKLGWSGFLLPD